MGEFALKAEKQKHLKKLIAGSVVAFEEIYLKYAKRLNYHAFMFTKSRFVTEEIIQEVFIKLWVHRVKLKPDTDIEAYLFRMVRNRAIDYFRKTVQHEDLAEEYWQDVLKSTTRTDDFIISKEYNAILDQIMEGLPPRKRIIYQLSRHEGKTNQEIAVLLGISTKTVKNQLSEATQIIKAQLNPHLETTLTILAILLFS